MINHTGNVQNQLMMEEHDGTLNAKRVTVVGAAGQVTITPVGLTTLAPSPNYIGLVTVGGIGTLTLADPKGYIGLTTTTNGAGDRFIGLVTNVQAGLTTLAPSPSYIGLVTVGGIGTLTLADPKGYIGLVTASLGIGTQFIGLVTSVTRNAGTNKTLIPLPVGLGNNSIAVVATPTNAQKINVTQLVLNSNITTEIAIRSGVTYLTGNASLGMTIYPGGGFVMSGSPDSPSWIGLPSGALTIEKRDGGGTISKIGGGVIYFDE